MDPASASDVVLDLALVEACQQGAESRGEDAFRALHDRHRDAVLRTCLRVTGDLGDALDAAQEAFLLAFRGIGGLRQGARFSPWLLRIATRVSIEYRRRPRLALRFTDLAQGDIDPRHVGRHSDPGCAVELRERRVHVRRALRRLSPRFRQVLALRYFEQLSHDELARRLAIAAGSVKSRLHRAHAALGAALLAGAREPWMDR